MIEQVICQSDLTPNAAPIRLPDKAVLYQRTKGSGTHDASLAMMFKLAKTAEKNWRQLNGHLKIIPLLQGIKFTGGMIQDAANDQKFNSSKRRLAKLP
jgi:hypothetical protein